MQKYTQKEFENLSLFKELLNNDRVVFLDTETTGVNDEAEFCELAIANNKGEVLLDRMIKPSVPMTEGASQVSGITDEMLKNKPEYKEIHNDIKNVTDGKVIVGWNLDFDIRIIKQTSEKNGEVIDLNDNTVIDLMKVFGDYFKTNVWLKQDEVGQAFKMNSEKHRALDDVLDMIELCKNVVNEKEHDDIINHVPEKKKEKILRERMGENDTSKLKDNKKVREPAYKKYVSLWNNNKDTNEIATELNVQENTVKQNLYKAMDVGEIEYKKLCAAYEDKINEFEKMANNYLKDNFSDTLKEISGYKYTDLREKLEKIGAKLDQFHDYLYNQFHKTNDDKKLDIDESLLGDIQEANMDDEVTKKTLVTEITSYEYEIGSGEDEEMDDDIEISPDDLPF